MDPKSMIERLQEQAVATATILDKARYILRNAEALWASGDRDKRELVQAAILYFEVFKRYFTEDLDEAVKRVTQLSKAEDAEWKITGTVPVWYNGQQKQSALTIGVTKTESVSTAVDVKALQKALGIRITVEPGRYIIESDIPDGLSFFKRATLSFNPSPSVTKKVEQQYPQCCSTTPTTSWKYEVKPLEGD